MNKDISEYKPGQIWFSEEAICFWLVLKVVEQKTGSKVHFLESESSEIHFSDDFGELIFNHDFKLIW